MKSISHLLFFLFPLVTFAQNLVLNPSFEMIDACPNSLGQFYKADFWTSPVDTLQTSPDLFHTCATSTLVTVPNNFSGSQLPHSGGAYAGIITTSLFPQGSGSLNNYREYLQGELTVPLVAGKEYTISFWVSPSDNWKYGTPKLGMHLRNNQIGPFQNQATNSFLPITPQLINDSIPLNNTSTWTQLEWTYNAVGGEQYFIIGHFDNDTIMNLTTVNPNATGGYANQAYYYIDDVSIGRYTLSDVNTQSTLNTFSASPNPANNLITIDVELSKVNVLRCNFLNSTGQLLSANNWGEIKDKKFTLDASNLASGIYFVQLIFDDSIVTKKVVIQH
jgi:hypothetical protein